MTKAEFQSLCPSVRNQRKVSERYPNIELNAANRLCQLFQRTGGGSITSSYRSYRENKACGGATRSQHLYGKAFDVKFNCDLRYAYLEASKLFDGIGVNRRSGWLHVDTRGYKARWYYRSGGGTKPLNTGVLRSWGWYPLSEAAGAVIPIAAPPPSFFYPDTPEATAIAIATHQIPYVPQLKVTDFFIENIGMLSVTVFLILLAILV